VANTSNSSYGRTKVVFVVTRAAHAERAALTSLALRIHQHLGPGRYCLPFELVGHQLAQENEGSDACRRRGGQCLYEQPCQLLIVVDLVTIIVLLARLPALTVDAQQ